MEKRYTESIGPIPNPVIQPMFGQYNMPHTICDILYVSYHMLHIIWISKLEHWPYHMVFGLFRYFDKIKVIMIDFF